MEANKVSRFRPHYDVSDFFCLACMKPEGVPTEGDEVVLRLHTVMKVIYMGFPMRLCSNPACNEMSGFWSWIPTLYFDGKVAVYEGNYWGALWAWLKGEGEDGKA